jgi:hypothetical protein
MGTGFIYGALRGAIFGVGIPGAGPISGALIGGVIGAGAGALKGVAIASTCNSLGVYSTH